MTKDDFRIVQRSMDGRYAVEERRKKFWSGKWVWERHREYYIEYLGERWFDSLDLAQAHIDCCLRVENNTEKVVWP